MRAGWGQRPRDPAKPEKGRGRHGSREKGRQGAGAEKQGGQKPRAKKQAGGVFSARDNRVVRPLRQMSGHREAGGAKLGTPIQRSGGARRLERKQGETATGDKPKEGREGLSKSGSKERDPKGSRRSRPNGGHPDEKKP